MYMLGVGIPEKLKLEWGKKLDNFKQIKILMKYVGISLREKKEDLFNTNCWSKK